MSDLVSDISELIAQLKSQIAQNETLGYKLESQGSVLDVLVKCRKELRAAATINESKVKIGKDCAEILLTMIDPDICTWTSPDIIKLCYRELKNAIQNTEEIRE